MRFQSESYTPDHSSIFFVSSFWKSAKAVWTETCHCKSTLSIHRLKSEFASRDEAEEVKKSQPAARAHDGTRLEEERYHVHESICLPQASSCRILWRLVVFYFSEYKMSRRIADGMVEMGHSSDKHHD